MFFYFLFSFHQVEHLPILIDSPKKLDHQLSSDPDNTPVSNAANSDSETDDISQPGEPKHVRFFCVADVLVKF